MGERDGGRIAGSEERRNHNTNNSAIIHILEEARQREK
jgi:hypothetical protein